MKSIMIKCNHVLVKIIQHYITWILTPFYFHLKQKGLNEFWEHLKKDLYCSDMDPSQDFESKDNEKIFEK